MEKVLLISASTSTSSINSNVMRVILSMVNFDSLYLSDYVNRIPFLTRTKQESKDLVPKSIVEIYKKINRFEKIVIFAPEHNAYFSAFFKNVIDWLSVYKLDFLDKKHLIVVSVSVTSKKSRKLESGIKETFSHFSPKTYKFVNFNNYSDKLSDDRFYRLLEEIL